MELKAGAEIMVGQEVTYDPSTGYVFPATPQQRRIAIAVDDFKPGDLAELDPRTGKLSRAQTPKGELK